MRSYLVMKKYIAHFRENEKKEEQLLLDHLLQTAEIAKRNGAKFGLSQNCYVAGLIHDCGKFSDAFQEYIQAARRGEEVQRGSVDHSTYGGQIVWQLFDQLENPSPFEKVAVEMITNAVFAHHNPGGLLDFITGEGQGDSPFLNRTKKDLKELNQVKERFFSFVCSEEELENYIKIVGQEVKTLFEKQGGIKRTEQFYLLKMIYSALLDGDRCNTQQFESGNYEEGSEKNKLFKTFSKRLEEQFTKFEQGPVTPINNLRQKMAKACLSAADNPTGIYQLSIPTGGGKTLSSMRFGLNHAIKHNKERIIYIIPYSSIIEQNAKVFRDVLRDDDHILEHHSNLVSEYDDESEESERRQALMQDNWESEIIVTTMVRFLENVFSRSTRNPRRIHQLLNSVLIFDEVQSLPPKCLAMFNSLINFLKKYGNTTTLLCTATQPTLDKTKLPLQISLDAEIVPQLEEVASSFERVKVIDKTLSEGWDEKMLTTFSRDILVDEKNLLIILNTKNAVRSVYRELKEVDPDLTVFHLSTGMTPNHRSETLEKVKGYLDNKEKFICVTTPLIEAGVDISFACVIRSLTGLDSIAQAAGRCNRNGESTEKQPVYLINPIKQLENVEKLTEIQTKSEITRTILKDRKFTGETDSLLSPRKIQAFFKLFYNRVERTNESEYLFADGSKTLFELMSGNKKRLKFYRESSNFQSAPTLVSSSGTIAKHFHVIQQQGQSVLVEFGEEAMELIADLNGSEKVIFDKKWYQKAQRNSLNLFQYEYQQLVQDGLIKMTSAGIAIIPSNAYDKQFGLNIEGDSKSGYQSAF